MNCQDRKIIVTGGSSGYGYGIAKALRARGARVLIIGRRPEVLAEAARTLEVESVAGDVADGATWDRAFAALGGCDVLINNAGAGVRIVPLAEYTDDEIRSSIDTNLVGVLLGCARAARIMCAQQSGLIVNISSVCAHYGWPGFTPYTAAKAGLDMMSRALYTEVRPHHVRVTVVTPSWGATNFGAAAQLPPGDPAVTRQKMTGDEMGELIVRLCEAPDHLEFPEIMVQPTVQEIIPF